MSTGLKFFLFFVFVFSFGCVIMFDRAMSGKSNFGFSANETPETPKSTYSIKKAVIDDQEKIRESYEKREERIEALKQVGRELGGN